MAERLTNPFRYGALALDEAFTDRRAEVADLKADVLNGQDVVVVAPRRFGKSSLMWRVAQQLLREKVLVAQVNLMTTPTKSRLAEKLARAIHEDIASPLFRAKERLSVFQGLRIRPIVTVDPDDGSLSFSFEASAAKEDLDATLERLFELPAQISADRGRPVALILDEFQEVVDIDPELPKLMRSVFQEQPEVAHVYLGSKRHMMERIFNDENEPFWRSAKSMQLGPIDARSFGSFIRRRFEATGKAVEPAVVDAVLEITGGHPYSTQELCYFLWQEVAAAKSAGPAELDRALAEVLASENAHFGLIWERATAPQRVLLEALAREPGLPFGSDYRRRHGLPSPSTMQRALESLERQELVVRERGTAHIAEPFLAEWIRADEG
jgi:uncharacterized protein